jgi:hypothetical protein
MQVWIAASTIIATVLFGLIFRKNRRAAMPNFGGILLLAWWICASRGVRLRLHAWDGRVSDRDFAQNGLGSER